MSTATLPKIGATGFAVRDFARPPEPSSIPFDMPPIYPGQIVNFYPNCNPSVAPVPAAVIQVQSRRVTVASLANRLPITDGWVRHAADPLTIKKEERENGCWDYTARDRELFSMMLAMQHMQQCLAVIARELQIELPMPGERDQDAPLPEAPRVELTPEEAKAQQAALLEAMEDEAGELGIEEAPVPREERVRRSR
jgi:hypothetical protein